MENRNYTVAIDLGSSDVVVAVGSPSEGGKVSIQNITVRPSKGVVGGEVKNVEQAAQSVKDAVSAAEQELGIRIASAFTGISGQHIKCVKHTYYVHVAAPDGEIMQQDVKNLNDSMGNVQAPDGHRLLQIMPQLYFVSDDEEVRDPVGMFGKTLGSTFNLIIGENNILLRQEKAFGKVDIKQAKLFINALAVADAVAFPDEKELGVAVVDIGAGTTDVCIFQDGIMRHVGVVPMGADAINKDIRSYGIMERYVEELKTKYGSAMPSAVDSEKLIKLPGRTPNDHKEISFQNLAAIIEARLQDIIEYVLDEIKASGYEERLGAGIILTGGCALLKDIQELLEAKTGYDVRIAAPTLLVDEESQEKVADPRFSAAVGMLWQGIRSGAGTRVETMRPSATTRITGGEDEADPFADEDEDVVKGRGKKTKEPRQPKQPKEPKQEKPKGDGFFTKFKKQFEKTFDFDVLDDDNDMI